MVSIRQFGRHLCGGSLVLVLALSGLALNVLVPVEVAAQVTTATLSGTVVDPTEAVVPKAKIVLTSRSTGVTRTVVSNGEGVFSFSAVPSGDFNLTVTSKGFETYTETGIHLDPQDNRVLREIKLTLGSESSVVTVAETDAGINVDSGEISSLISAEDIKHLSIEGRDVTELLKILPGFTPVSTGVTNSVYDPSQVTIGGAVGNYSGNGSPLYAVALLSDGTDLTDPGNFGSAIQNVNYDQVAEVKVQTSSMTADTAHGPIIINAVGASGGNRFHGSLYTYARTNQLDSQDWYSKHTSQPKAPDRQVYPGFTFGGPVLIPHTHFNEARKLNFWVGAEQYAQRDVYAYGSAATATVTALVPTAGMRKGDYSQSQIAQYLGDFYSPTNPNTTTTTGQPQQPNMSNFDMCPGTNYYVNSNYNGICAQPVTGQATVGGVAQTPQAVTNGDISAFLDPGATILLNQYPLPTPGLVPTEETPYNYINTNLVNNNLWQARGRIDYAPGEKSKIFAVYSAEKGITSNPQVPYYNPDAYVPLGGVDTPGGGYGDVIHTQLAAINVSTIFTPTLTNEFYLSGSLFQENWKDKSSASTISATGYPYQGIYTNGSNVLPQIGDYAYAGLPLLLWQDYGANGFDINKFIRTVGDNATKQLGTHTIRVGAFAQWDINNQIGNYNGAPTNGQITNYYNPVNYKAPDGEKIYNTGPLNGGMGNNILADVAEGHISSFTQQNVGPGGNLYFWNIDGYAQDHWRALRHLSVDYGVRIEHITPWSDAHGVGIPAWNPAAYITDQAGSPLPGLLWHSIDHSVPLSGYTTRWGYIEPRVGFSWDVYKEGKTILRGGFGIYRAHDSFNDAAKGQSEAAGVRTLVENQTTLGVINKAQAPINVGLSPAQYAASNNGGLAIYGVKGGDDEEPQVKTWDAAVVQKLPQNMQLQIAYVGSYSNKMIDNGGQGSKAALDNINALPVGALYSTGQYTTQDFNQIASLNGLAVDAFRQYPSYAGIYIASHRLYSNYNGLQTSLTKQTGHLLLNVNYTFSKALGVLGGDQNGTPVDPFNLRNNYGPETFDRTNVFNASYVYQEGSPFHLPLAKYFLNEWEVSGITNLLSGPSEQSINPDFGLTGTITGAADPVQGNPNNSYTLPLTSQAFLGTPDVSLQPKLLCNPTTGTGNHVYFNNACFGLPTQIGTNGTYRFPYLKGPAYLESDLTVTKNISLREGQSLHLRLAAFNFLNRANPSFNSNQNGNYTLSYNYSNSAVTAPASPALLASIPNTNADIFGHADLKQGRRVVELSLKYNF
jgi:hypothetical protein